MSRGYVDERDQPAGRRLPLSRARSASSARWTLPPASSASSEIKGMMLYKVTSLAFDPDARKAYYTEDNYAFRDLIEVDVDTGKKRMLLRDARIGDLVLNPRDKSIWGIRHQNGFATIVRIPPPYAGFNQIHTFDYGITPFDLDISPDGCWSPPAMAKSTATSRSGCGTLQTFEAGGGPEEVARLDLPPSTPEGFIFTPDGKSLYGTTYYTGVSNVFRFDIASQKFEVLSATPRPASSGRCRSPTARCSSMNIPGKG